MGNRKAEGGVEMNGGEDLRYEDTMFYHKAQVTKEAINALFHALNAPSRWRRWLIKKIFPEIIEVIDTFYKEVYWEVRGLRRRR